MKARRVIGCLGFGALFVVGLGVFVAWNWDAVSTRFSQAVSAQSEKTRTTMFRVGELASIGAQLESEYGTKPEMSYDAGENGRTLGISLMDHFVPDGATPESHAREIAKFAIGQTKKADEIDAVEVRIQSLAGDPTSHAYAIADLRAR
ncbi:MAG: hypothetical protein OEV00_13920 [Acidobacteriota bacterium]|nr:hypothetical protein [Acidobacteriota bacterium]MDH3786407.1 hypothetical protein [Acidobacteriota bacterium]